MKIKISNSSTFNHRISIYFMYAILIALIIVLFINLILLNYSAVLIVSIFLIGLTIITFHHKKYASLLCDAFIDDSFLYLNNGKNKDKIELNNIKTLYYSSFFSNVGGEGTIVVNFRKETIFGTKIYIFPTNLNKQKKYKFNRHILDLILSKANNYKPKTK